MSSTLTTKAIAKVAAVATGLGMATSLLSLAPMAHAAALSQTQIDSIISLLQSFGADSTTVANVRASLNGQATTGTTGGSMSSSCSFTMDLHMGSSGAQVTCLQNALIAGGYAIPAGATGYFGAQTQSAVMAWQKAAGVSPAAGYFGAISRAAFNLGGSTGTGTGSTSTTLTGTGRFTDESSLGDVTSTLYAGNSSTAVVGDSFTATNGDVQLQRVDATFDLSAITGGSSPSTNLDRYVGEVSLWLGDKKLASMDASAGDKSSNIWTYRFSGLSAVVKKGDQAKIYVKVTPLSSIGTHEDGATLTVKLLADSVRAIAGDGISDTYVTTAITQTFSVSSATTGTLTASPASDNPVAGQVAVSSSTTSGVKILSFNLKAKNAAADMSNLRVSFITSDNNLSDVVNTVYLMKGSTVLKSSTLSTGNNGVVTFTNLNESIAKDATQNYTIVVDLKGENTAYSDGTTLIASTTVAGWDVSDSSGASVTPSAAVAGNTQTLTGTGISVVMGTPSASVQTASFSGGLDTASFAIPFTVTAGDTAIWIGGTATATTSTGGKTNTAFGSNNGVVFATTTTSTATTTTSATASVSASNTDSSDANSNFYVGANSSRTFTLNVATGATSNNTPASPVEVGFMITGINYDSTSTMHSTYYTSNISTFKTSDVYVQKH